MPHPAAEAREAEPSIQTDREFHFAACRAAGVDMLAAQAEEFWMSMGPILNVFHNDVATSCLGEEHPRIVDAPRRRE